VLFLDEFTEFRRDVVEGLRQPTEDGRVVVTRMAGTVEFPSRFTLVAAANPCPCGFLGDLARRCICRGDRLETYAAKLTGPLIDRVDIRLVVPRLTRQELVGEEAGGRGARPTEAPVRGARLPE
jgi:magnesium chelatase family protein